MPVIRRHAVLQTGSRRAPQVAPPDPRRAIEIRGGEDTTIIFEILDDGGSIVPIKTGDQLLLVVRPTPAVDDERLIRQFATPALLEGPNIWSLTLTATLTKHKSTEFSRGFYSLALIRQTGQTTTSTDFVIEPTPFRLLGSPAAQ
jgi:hypothetical protein